MICLFNATAWAQDADESEKSEITGTLEMGVRVVDDNSDGSKSEEYRDMDSGAWGSAWIRANQENNYILFEGNNIALDDQSYKVVGGKYDHFKFTLFFDETPHNFTENARSYLNGAGSNMLTNSGNISDPSLWQTFDYYKERKNVGMTGESSFASPWYAKFGAGRRDTEGTYPFAGSGGVELPAPVDWEEKNLFVEGGFRGKQLIWSVRADVSDFDNQYNVLTWDSNTSSLQPDSDFYKLAGKAIYRPPFLDSVFALRTSYSQKDNESSLAEMDATASGTYHAEVETFNIYGSWGFVPAPDFDIKIYSRYTETDDNSDTITINSVTTEPYDHEKWTTGLEGTWQMPKRNYLDAGYRYVDAKRSSRSDNDENQDDLIFLQYRNRFFKRIDFKARYEYLDRQGDYIGDDDDMRRYDVADQTRNKLSLGTDLFILDYLSGGIEYAWWERDFDDTVYGMTGMEHHEAYVSANYGDPKLVLLMVYFGYEFDESKLDTSRNWSQAEEFDTIAYGISIEFPLMEDRLKLVLSWDHTIVDGSVDFTPKANDYENLTDVDDFTLQTFAVKTTYKLTSAWRLKCGYTYEKFDLDDGQYNGYAYLPSGATLTGAYRDEDYDAHIAWLGAEFRF